MARTGKVSAKTNVHFGHLDSPAESGLPFCWFIFGQKATIMYLTPQKSLYLHSRIFLEGPNMVCFPRIRSHVSFLLRSGKLGTKKIHT